MLGLVEDALAHFVKRDEKVPTILTKFVRDLNIFGKPGIHFPIFFHSRKHMLVHNRLLIYLYPPRIFLIMIRLTLITLI